MNQISEEPQMNSSEIGYLQDDGQPDESPPIVVYVEDAKRKKQYKCRYCQVSHHSMKYVSQLHRFRCKERKKIKAVEVYRRTRERTSQQKVEKMQNQYDENEQDENNAAPNESKNDEEGHDQPLKKRVKVLQQNYMKITESNHLSAVNKSKLADIFARQVFDDIGSLLISNLRTMFKSAAEKALHSGMDIVSQKNAISESLIYSVQNVKIGEVFFDFMECLKTAHIKLQKRHSEETRTHQNNERAFEFFSKFNHFHFEYQVTLLKEMMELKKFPRNDFIRYFNCLRETDSFFSKFPKMNRIDGKISNPRPLVSLQQVIQKVVELQVSNHPTLCCDIWFCATMGLRGSQLLRISVVASDGRFAKSIKIEERKNSNIAVRYLPESLIQLIRFTKTSYPLSLQRLKEAKSVCIEAFRSFYTLRHTCLTTILSALASLNEYGRFHKSSLMTSKYYINKNQEKLINSVFKLPFKYENTSIALDYQRDIMLDFCGQVAVEIRLQPNKEFEISVETNQKFSEQQDADSILTGDTITETSSLNEKEKLKMNCQVYLYKNFKSSVVDGSSDIIGALKKYVNPNTQSDFEKALQRQIAEEGHYPDVISCIEKASKILKLKILYYEFIEGSNDPQIHTIGKGTIQAVLSKIGDDFFVDDDVIVSKLVEDFDSLSIKSNQSDKFPLHTNRNPLCNRCGQSKKRIPLEYGIENDEILLLCPKCQYNRVICDTVKPRGKPELRDKYIKITSKYKKTIKNTFHFIGYKNCKNNFLEVVQKDFGLGSHASESLFSKSIPDELKSVYLRMSEELENQIQMNRDYQLVLPLTIKKSTISRGGRGVFSLEPIRKNTIILTYIGVACDVTEIDLNDDSLFSLGWVQFSESDSKQLYLMPKFSLNAARYINSADKLNQANCRVGMGIFKNQEIVIFIYSSKQIKAHQQLFYPYSNKTYWRNKKE